jgi:ubiquinone/menaquinone biosynthesis C-methylase UbiE
MSEFDARAREWDKNLIHIERSQAIAEELQKMIPIEHSMKALEYGAGTAILSFLLKDKFAEITLMDNSSEMIKVCEEKAEYFKTRHIYPLFYDLEHNDFEVKFDITYNQMVMHHVKDIEKMFSKFYALLNPGGYLAIADLYPEDGSFHGPDVDVHLGFNPEKITEILKKIGFSEIEYMTCFEIKREANKLFPVFLLKAKKL